MNTILSFLPLILVTIFVAFAGLLIIRDARKPKNKVNTVSKNIHLSSELLAEIELFDDNKMSQEEFIERLFNRMGILLPESIWIKFKENKNPLK